ncbi:MAG: prolyl oligopeptidase family serine peptidase [Phycisphaera sp.]|nr:prolyl oligopeptidase family serine peptidase [Phycisphaera sp.]
MLTPPLMRSAAGQGTKADYERADGWRARVSGKVLNEELDARWLDAAFVYRREVADGPAQFIYIDLDNGERRFASDEEWTRAAPQRRGRRRPAVDRRAATSPDHQWTAEVRDRNVYLRAADGNEHKDDVHQLTSDGTETDGYVDQFYWSPDSSHLVVMREHRGADRKVYLIESSPKDQVQPKLHHYDYLKPGDDVWYARPRLFDVATMKEIAVDETLADNPWHIDDVAWDRDSTRFTYLFNQRGHHTLRVIAVDASSGKASAIVDEHSDTFIDYAYKTYLRRLDATGELIWMSERSGWNHLYLIDAKTGAVTRPITRGEWVVHDVQRVDEKKREVWFSASGVVPGQDPYYLHYGVANMDTGDVRFITEGDGTHKVWFSPDRQTVLDTYSRVDLAPVHTLRRVSDGKAICEVERCDDTALRDTGWRPPQRFVAKGADGKTDIYGVIWRPSNYDPKKTYPVIEDIYAGPHGAFVPKEFITSYHAQALAEIGFIVVKMDGRGTNWRSRAFHDVCYQRVPEAGFDDRIAWIKAAAKEDPAMDLTRVGIYGGSAGGQSSTWALIAHHDFYKVAVSDCGCHDNRMDKIWWNEAYMGWPVGEQYVTYSNVEQAHRLEGHLMLIVGELDHNVDPASTMQVVNALIKADKDFDLLVVPGSDHGAAEFPYGIRRRRDFFVRHLLGVEPRQ